MPAVGVQEGSLEESILGNGPEQPPRQIAFPPVSRDHIINCSYDQWFPKYRTSCLRSRIIPLTPEFISYIREDGIILADDDRPSGESATAPEDIEWHSSSATQRQSRVDDSGSDSDSEDAIPSDPPNHRFPELHKMIKDTIAALGGSVVPKLNWSSPKDATWISPHQNTLKCTSPNDIYLLLKSSNFVSFDLEHAFDDCPPGPIPDSFSHVLVLRPFFTPHTALEFRCFVKHRTLIGITQRDMSYYRFLHTLQPAIVSLIKSFFDSKLRFSFPDESFAFDVYIPEDREADDGLGRVRLIDINPWAPRTDSLLFDWGELLDVRVPHPILGSVTTQDTQYEIEGGSADDTTDDDSAEVDFEPMIRFVQKDDPAARDLGTSRYSAHKLPKEVVDASLAGEGGLLDFARQWKEITEGRGGDIWEPRPSAS